jgi:hypothetical protein
MISRSNTDNSGTHSPRGTTSPTSQGFVMNRTHRTHRTWRLSVTLAGLVAAALALPACQGTATAATRHHAAQATVQPTQNGLTTTDLKDLAKMKRDLSQRLLERSPRA